MAIVEMNKPFVENRGEFLPDLDGQNHGQSRQDLAHWTLKNEDILATIINGIVEDLQFPVPNDTIGLCGSSPLQILQSRPSDVLHYAKDKLYTWRFDQVPTQWRRLYEESCLHLAVQHLETMLSSSKYRRENRSDLDIDLECERSLAEAVKHLDNALFVAGAPRRKSLINQTLSQLEDSLSSSNDNSLLSPILVVGRPRLTTTEQTIPRCDGPISLEAFQEHLDSYGGPLVIPGALQHWPALSRWNDASYLLRRTLGGRRIVPVEIGTSYTDDSWNQETMQFSRFLDEFMLTDHPTSVGYLAQHDLFTQISRLRDDVTVPDYCYAAPPIPRGAAAQTFGLSTTTELDEPAMNAWLGPKGTKTPLHTDAYHNILCQAVGYKYVRLYAPEESSSLYPMGVDENGVDMGNTSAVDVRYMTLSRDDHVDEPDEDHPLFETARYRETILGPGECLYIPLGWFHYIESVTNSFSVSFWFN